MKAQERVDIELALITGHKVPCVCERQFEDCPPIGELTAIVNSRGMLIADVQCSDCWRCWRRFEHE